MKFLLFFLLIISFKHLNALKLDIISEINPSINSYNNLIANNKNYNLSYFTNTASLSFTLKKIPLEKTDSYMDISIGFAAYTINSSSKTINSLYLRDLNEYKELFLNKAFLKIDKFGYEDFILYFGKMPYQSGNGILISDNGKGLDGIKLDIGGLLFSDKVEFFYFKTHSFSDIDIFGTSYNKSLGDGIWQIYISNINSKNSKEPLSYFTKTARIYYGISYNLNKDNIFYSVDFIKQTGNSKKINSKLIDEAYAFKIEASWIMKLPLLRYTKTKAGYLKSSGGENQRKNKTFFSHTSKRTDGFNWIGLGNIYKAFSWGIAKTSNTLSGLPDNDSGIDALNVALEIPIKKISFLSFEFTRLKTTNSSISNDIGNEFAMKFINTLSKRLKLEVIYSSFNPKGQYKSLKSTNAIILSAKAEF